MTYVVNGEKMATVNDILILYNCIINFQCIRPIRKISVCRLT